jgi:hypothetical protein
MQPPDDKTVRKIRGSELEISGFERFSGLLKVQQPHPYQLRAGF